MTTIEQGFKAVRQGRPKHYIVLVFWLIFRWSKFKIYLDKLSAGMNWKAAYREAAKYKWYHKIK